MSKEANASTGAPELLEAESNLGLALAIIHRMLPRLEDSAAVTDVQSGFKRLVTCLESARAAHQRVADARKASASIKSQAGIAGETVAAIAAAVATVLGQPFRLVSVAKVPVPVPHINVWALEGRTQIFQSHQIR
jgi:hypothetical protein